MSSLAWDPDQLQGWRKWRAVVDRAACRSSKHGQGRGDRETGGGSHKWEVPRVSSGSCPVRLRRSGRQEITSKNETFIQITKGRRKMKDYTASVILEMV